MKETRKEENMRTIVKILLVCLLTILWATSAVAALTDNELLGKSIFFDVDLSINGNQSCASCHGLQFGWTGPLSDINKQGSVYEGSITGRFGDRKPPS